MLKYALALAVGLSAFAQADNAGVLLQYTSNNLSLGPSDVPVNCAVYADKVVVEKKIGNVKVTRQLTVKLEKVSEEIKAASEGKVDVEKAKGPIAGAGTRSYLAFQDDGKKEIILFKAEGGDKSTNKSVAGATLRNVLDTLCK